MAYEHAGSGKRNPLANTKPVPVLITKKPKAAPVPKGKKPKPLSASARRAMAGETLHLFPVRKAGGQIRLVALPIGNGGHLFGVQHLMPQPDGPMAPFGWVNFNLEEARELARVLAGFLEGGAE